MDIDKLLKILFILSAMVFLLTLMYAPSTDCEACRIEYNDDIINGYEAFELFEDECISYDNPWGQNIYK